MAELSSDPWRQKVAVLITDRPQHWGRQYSNKVISPALIAVHGYSDSELQLALKGTALLEIEIPTKILPLISVPRYCRLVASHYEELIKAGDFTADRLIYLEVLDRCSSKLSYPLTNTEVFQLIHNLAERASCNPLLNINDLMQLINLPGGDRPNVYQELVSGGLLVRGSEGLIDSFKVEPLRLVFGFGMLLADQLRNMSSSTPQEVEAFLSSWFEPEPDMDRKVDICGSAMFHAFLEDNFPEQALHELIRYWLSLRNWGESAMSAFKGYVLRRPNTFLAIAEEFWSSKYDHGAAQDFLGNAFSTYRDDPKLEPALTKAINRWVGLLHPYGHYSWKGSDGEQRERIRANIEERAGYVSGEIEVSGVVLTVTDDSALLSLARLALMLISQDPTRFADAFKRWAVAAAVMGEAEMTDVVAWTIRLCDGELDGHLLGHAQTLLSRGEAISSDAARILLEAIGNKKSSELIETHNLRPDKRLKRIEQHKTDPCKSFYEWSESESVDCMVREDIPLHKILQGSAISIVDPLITTPTS